MQCEHIYINQSKLSHYIWMIQTHMREHSCLLNNTHVQSCPSKRKKENRKPGQNAQSWYLWQYMFVLLCFTATVSGSRSLVSIETNIWMDNIVSFFKRICFYKKCGGKSVYIWNGLRIGWSLDQYKNNTFKWETAKRPSSIWKTHIVVCNIFHLSLFLNAHLD